MSELSYRSVRYPEAEQVPSAVMPGDTAVALGRHAKAMLLHLSRVEDLAEAAGVDLDGWNSPIGHLVRAARETVENLDLWAVNNAYRNGAGRSAYDGMERWCQTPGGVLPMGERSGR